MRRLPVFLLKSGAFVPCAAERKKAADPKVRPRGVGSKTPAETAFPGYALFAPDKLGLVLPGEIIYYDIGS